MSSKDHQRSEKLDKNAPGIVTLTVSPDKLRAIFPDTIESTTSAASSADALTPAPSTPQPAKDEEADNSKTTAVAKNDNASDSTPATPNAAASADTPSAMAPPNGAATASAAAADDDSSAAGKKKGSLKRTAAAAGVDGTNSAGPGSANGDTPQPPVRVRSKPGPKKKAKLDDGVEIRASAAGGAHKLGPKASMGAINAGLRALDRSGKPCRKWAKGSFQLKSFTGVQWSIPRWRAPPKSLATDTEGGDVSTSATASADGSNKENAKENGDSKDSKDAKDNKESDGKLKVNGHTNGTTNGDATATPSDVDMANTSAVPSPSVEPATEAATPVAAVS